MICINVQFFFYLFMNIYSIKFKEKRIAIKMFIIENITQYQHPFSKSYKR